MYSVDAIQNLLLVVSFFLTIFLFLNTCYNNCNKVLNCDFYISTPIYKIGNSKITKHASFNINILNRDLPFTIVFSVFDELSMRIKINYLSLEEKEKKEFINQRVHFNKSYKDHEINISDIIMNGFVTIECSTLKDSGDILISIIPDSRCKYNKDYNLLLKF